MEYATSAGTATAGEDYETTSETLTIGAGDATGTISIDVLDDEVWEQTETFEVTLRNPTGATIEDGGGVGTGTILDDEEEPTLSIDDVEVDEGAGSAVFTVRLSGRSAEAVTVEYATSDLTALAGSDYSTTSGTLTIAANDTTETITVAVLDDGIVEGDDETFKVTLSGANGATLADREGVGTIEDDDAEEPPLGDPTLRIEDVTVAEDEGPAEFTVTLSEASTGAVTVEYRTANVTATAGFDYAETSGTLTIAANNTTATIAVEVLNDGDAEGTERFTVELSGASGATIVDGEGVGTITDDDTVVPPPPPPPHRRHRRPTVEIDNVAVDEDGGPAEFTVTLSETSVDDVTVAYATEDGTAYAGSDYTTVSETLTIRAGSMTGTISVEVLDDEVIEGDERFAVRLSSASGATIVDGEGVGTIRDDDVEEPLPGQPTLRIGNVRVDEDDGPAEFTVTLSEASVDDVTVAYATEDGTAYASSDYTTVSETLTIRAGSMTGTISVEVLDDEVIEGDERFAVRLSSASGRRLWSEGVGTIRDDDVEEPAGAADASHRQCESGRGRWACGVHGDVERDERRRRDGGVCDRGRRHMRVRTTRL